LSPYAKSRRKLYLQAQLQRALPRAPWFKPRLLSCGGG
jgi:hypothetical protein